VTKNISSRTTLEKALRINLDEKKYGTIVEIGAGQEVARQFFRSGGAAGTIAKTMSAYDMNFSDAIYGVQEDKRYVSKSRVRPGRQITLQNFSLFFLRRDRRREELQGQQRVSCLVRYPCTGVPGRRTFRYRSSCPHAR
jgi:hypothetical protein